jgi:hypothetical protein
MPAMPTSPTGAVAESIRVQLGTDALVLITPGPRSRAVVIASVPGYPAHLTNARTALDSEPVKAAEVERIAYSVPETARAPGLSRELIYDELRSNRLGSVKAGLRRIIHRPAPRRMASGS